MFSAETKKSSPLTKSLNRETPSSIGVKPLSDKIDEKLKKREERYDRERRFRIKSSEDLETLEEVFDKRTLLTILKILNIGKLKEITGVLKAGKESRVYHGLDPQGKEVAVKIFLTSSNIFRQGRLKYIQGIRDSRTSLTTRDPWLTCGL